MMKDQAAGLRVLAAQKTGKQLRPQACRVIVVASGKGGVGKTNLTVNLGLALAELGLRVAVLDADMGLANVDIVLGITPRYNLTHVLAGERRISDIMVRGPMDLGILAGGSGVAELADLSQRRLEMFIASLRELDNDLDLFLIDAGSGISRSVLTFALAATEVAVVTTPEPTAMADAYGLIKVITARNFTVELRVIVNMAENEKQGEAVFNKLNSVAQRFLSRSLDWMGTIPRDILVQRAVREQQPFYLAYPRCRAAKAIGQLAQELTGGKFQVPVSGGLGGLFRRMAALWL